MNAYIERIHVKYKGLCLKTKLYIKDVMLNVLASSYFTPPYAKKIILAHYGHILSKGSKIYPGCFFGNGPGRLHIGTGTYINYHTFLDLGNDIVIGNNCSISFCCIFINSTHCVGSSSKRAGKSKSAPIYIEDGCWIGANVTIMPGVTIKQGCVIGTNSLVTRDTEPNGMYLGQPARRIKDL